MSRACQLGETHDAEPEGQADARPELVDSAASVRTPKPKTRVFAGTMHTLSQGRETLEALGRAWAVIASAGVLAGVAAAASTSAPTHSHLEGSWIGTQTCQSSLLSSSKCDAAPELDQPLTLTANGSGTFQHGLVLKSVQVSQSPRGDSFATGEVFSSSGEVHGTYMVQASADGLIGTWSSWTGTERLFVWNMKRGRYDFPNSR